MEGSGSLPVPQPGASDEERRDWAAQDQRLRTRRYLRRIAIRVLALPVLFIVPHSWVPFVTVIAVIAAMSAVIGGNDPDAARDFIHDDGSQIHGVGDEPES